MIRSYFLMILGLMLLACGCSQSPENQRIETLLRKMTLRQKVGQLFLAGVTRREITQELKRVIAKDYLGGFVLLPEKNFTHAAEAAGLINQLQQVALASTEIPLFICTRQEGGLVQSLNRTTGATDTPGNFALGVNGSFEDTYSVYRIMARELRATGMNLILAPVVNHAPANPAVMTQLRLFSTASDLTAKLSQAAVRGFQQNGMIAAAGFFPEFPGIGIPDQPPSGSTSAPPSLQAVISEDVSAIRVTSPAVSHRWIDYLRQKLAFKNLIITDDLDQPEWPDSVNFPVSAIQAGVELIVQQTTDFERIRQQIEVVVRAVETGEIPRKQINESVRKILRLKSAYQLFENSIADLSTIQKRVGTPEALQESLEISRRCVTVHRDVLKLLPLKKSTFPKILLLTPDSLASAAFFQEACAPGKNLLELMRREITDIQEIRISESISESLAVEITKIAGEMDLILLLNLATQSDSLASVVAAINKPVIQISLVPPPQIPPQISTHLVSAGARRINLQATVDVLFGRHSQAGLRKQNY